MRLEDCIKHDVCKFVGGASCHDGCNYKEERKKISISDYPTCVCGNNDWLKVDIYLKCSACGILCIVSDGLDDELESERILNQM